LDYTPPTGIWRVRKFSSDDMSGFAQAFMEEDYIRDFDEFMDSVNETAIYRLVVIRRIWH
jgi:hypothetical protein